MVGIPAFLYLAAISAVLTIVLLKHVPPKPLFHRFLYQTGSWGYILLAIAARRPDFGVMKTLGALILGNALVVIVQHLLARWKEFKEKRYRKRYLIQ